MRLGEGVEWSIHCCTLLASLPDGRLLPGARLAEFHDVPGPYLAKHLQRLAAAGIVEAIPGRAGGYRLARPADSVTLADIVLAVEGEARAFRCTEIRRRGPAAGVDDPYTKPCGIAAAMWRAEQAWRAELATVTVADLVAERDATLDPSQVQRARAWFVEAVR